MEMIQDTNTYPTANNLDFAATIINHAQFKADWSVGDALPKAQPGSREFFLTERYVLYSEFEGELYRARIYHEPWELYKAELTSFGSTMLEGKLLPQPKSQPILHYAEQISVDIWMLESVDD